MKYTFSPLLILFICFFGTASAQKDTTLYYLDSSLTAVPKSQAICIEKVYFKDALWHAIVSYRFKPYRIMTGSYADKNLTTPHGEFTYFLNDTVIMQGNYSGGAQDGTWKKWTTAGLVTDSVVFNNGNVLANGHFKYHENNTLWRFSLELPGNEKVTREFDTANVMVSQGRFKGTDGEMYLYYPDGKVKSHSVYKNSQRIIYDLYDERGNKK